jgi:hypothetical protein
MNDIEINESNFHEYFRDTRVSKLEKGDVIAKYSAVAEFVDGNEKRQIISLLTGTENKMEATVQVMRKLLYASEADAIKVPKQMAEDLLGGMSEEECAKKPYKYILEMFYYTKPDYVPKDPHWTCISLLNADDFVTREFSDEENKKMNESIKSKILSDSENQDLNKEIK